MNVFRLRHKRTHHIGYWRKNTHRKGRKIDKIAVLIDNDKQYKKRIRSLQKSLDESNQHNHALKAQYRDAKVETHNINIVVQDLLKKQRKAS